MFDDYGCIVCAATTEYQSNGMCRNCAVKITKRIKRSLRRRSKMAKTHWSLPEFRRRKLAKRLLANFVPEKQSSQIPPSLDVDRPYNPIYAALAVSQAPRT